MKYKFEMIALLSPIVILGACTTTPVAPPVNINTPSIVQTCIPIDTLRKVIIPAVTKSGFSIVSIETAPEQYYDETANKWITIEIPPIERKEPWTKTITPEQIIYVNADNKEITDICELKSEELSSDTALTQDDMRIINSSSRK